MTIWAAYLAQSAARTPHPYIHILRNMGQLSKFCPALGHVVWFADLNYSVRFQSFVCVLGRLGRIGQKNAGYVRARILRGWGVSSFTCRSRISALCAPRAPPGVFTSCFQGVVCFRVLGEFCPV